MSGNMNFVSAEAKRGSDAKSKGISREMMVRAQKTGKPNGETPEVYLRKITHLHLGEKRISTLSNAELVLCKNLRVLHLHGNAIRKMESLVLPKLTHLYLQNNIVESIGGLEHVGQSLSKLYLTGNHISSLDGLQECTSLTELHIQDQTLPKDAVMRIPRESLIGISRNLTFLDISHAGVVSIEPLSELKALEILDASKNNISDIKDVCRYTSQVDRLGTLDLRDNAVTKVRKYRDQVVLNSTIGSLDGKAISSQQRQFLHALKAKKAKAKSNKKKSNEDLKTSADIGLFL